MMKIYKNVLNTENFICQKTNYNTQVEIGKISKNNKNTKSHFLQILKKLIQSGVKSVYDRD
ncbi:hypothetical protein C6497_05600 [Candidatus Poribacteria bacterium]|nr:MAG: hypothetical protein C6497_05600 [Candidatus Poribacteria bacterium]